MTQYSVTLHCIAITMYAMASRSCGLRQYQPTQSHVPVSRRRVCRVVVVKAAKGTHMMHGRHKSSQWHAACAQCRRHGLTVVIHPIAAVFVLVGRQHQFRYTSLHMLLLLALLPSMLALLCLFARCILNTHTIPHTTGSKSTPPPAAPPVDSAVTVRVGTIVGCIESLWPRVCVWSTIASVCICMHVYVCPTIHTLALFPTYSWQTTPDWVQAPQASLYTSSDAAAPPQAYAAVPQYPVAPPPPPPPAPVAAASAGFPWYVWVGVGVFAANIGAKVCFGCVIQGCVFWGLF